MLNLLLRLCVLISASAFLIFFGILSIMSPYIVVPRNGDGDLDLALFIQNSDLKKFMMLRAMVMSGFIFLSFGIILAVRGM